MLKLEELTWPELEALDRAHTVIFVSISPIEEHGPHLPLGTDLYTCQALTEATAAQVEAQCPGFTAVLAPLLPIGSGTVPYLALSARRPGWCGMCCCGWGGHLQGMAFVGWW